MKKPNLHFYGALILISALLNSCLSFDPDNMDEWTIAEKESYEHVLIVQDQIGNDLYDCLLTMDSMDAINQAYQAFLNSETVSSATINSQGIAVQYSNGMRGGIFLNPRDEESELGKPEPLSPLNYQENSLKSLVNKRKMILINPHYFERRFYTDQIKRISSANLSRVDIDLSTFYVNEEATVDRFTELSGYGIIQIYSHGWAWPKEENITDVYLLTGETANDVTSAKYWNELKTGNIPIMKIAGPNKYLVAPQFIRDYNDFSKDTVMFYGGFCYSFLGNWPDIIETFADGSYLGFDWSVYTNYNANWSVNSIFNLSDTSLSQAMNLEAWMQDASVEKSYWNEEDQRTVHIYYTGDGDLKLWEDVSVSLEPLSDDGAPVTVPGEAGVPYPFECTVVSTLSELEYLWDIGDGSSPVKASNAVNITWSENGDYELSVTVLNKNDGSSIGAASLAVTIGEPNDDIIEFLRSCRYVASSFGYTSAFIFSPAGGGSAVHMSANCDELTFSGLSFSGEAQLNDLGSTCSISGSISSDGQKVSYVANVDLISEFTGKTFNNYTLTVSDLPLSLINYEGDGNRNPARAVYGQVYTGKGYDFKKYVTKLEGYEVDALGATHTVTGINWDELSYLTLQLGK